MHAGYKPSNCTSAAAQIFNHVERHTRTCARHTHAHTPSHLESGEADVLIHTAGSGQPVLKASQTYKYALFFLMIEKIKAPDSSVSKCYLSEQKRFPGSLPQTPVAG